MDSEEEDAPKRKKRKKHGTAAAAASPAAKKKRAGAKRGGKKGGKRDDSETEVELEGSDDEDEPAGRVDPPLPVRSRLGAPVSCRGMLVADAHPTRRKRCFTASTSNASTCAGGLRCVPRVASFH